MHIIYLLIYDCKKPTLNIIATKKSLLCAFSNILKCVYSNSIVYLIIHLYIYIYIYIYH